MKKLTTLGLGLSLALALPGAARAQGDKTGTPEKPEMKPEADKGDKKDPKDSTPTKSDVMGSEAGEFVALTRFLEARRTGDWAKAEQYFYDLTKDYPKYKQNIEYLYKQAECQFNQGKGKYEAAAATLQTILEKEPTHILSLFLLARIRAESDKPVQKEEAKEHLINAAKNGLFVLKELFSNKDVAATFQYLKENPQFILRCMKASQEFQAGPLLNKARNPFQTPWRLIAPQEGGGGTGRPGQDLAKAQELEGKITALFEDIEKLARDQKIDELIGKFSDLNTLMSEYGLTGVTQAEAKLKQWEKRLEEFKEIRLAIKLQIFITQGNQYLQLMSRAIQAEKFDEVFEKFGLLKGLVEKMKQEEREEFQRNGDALYVRGKALDDEAHKLKKIKEFNLIVTGIVIDPRPDSKDRAIINNKIYEVGDPVTDGQDNEIPGLRVVKINEGSVKFRYEDVEFFRELKPQQ